MNSGRKAEKLVILDWATMGGGSLTTEPFHALAETVEVYPLTKPEETISRIGDADLVICNKVLMTEAVMDACPKLRYVGLLATGFNNVDIAAADAHGITVCNAGSYSTDAVAQLVFSYILDYSMRVSEYAAAVRNGAWERSETFSYFPIPTAELSGKTLAVIGYGSIGKAVAKIGAAFGMEIVVATRTVPKDCPYRLVTTDEAFALADILTLHCPLNEGTKGIVNREHLSKMKKTAVLINTSRGGVVVEQDLADALNAETIAAAYLDVLEREPMTADTPLKTAKNCIITPHIAWTPLDTRMRLCAIVTENVRAFLDGRPMRVVNHPRLDG